MQSSRHKQHCRDPVVKLSTESPIVLILDCELSLIWARDKRARTHAREHAHAGDSREMREGDSRKLNSIYFQRSLRDARALHSVLIMVK